MTASNYLPPADRLLQIGDPREKSEPADYLALGLGPEQIPDLIRMLQDAELNTADSASLEVWAPLHAWRALGQLRAKSAIEPLLGMLRRIDDEGDEWVGGELPGVFGQIGPAAIAPLEQYAGASHSLMFARSAAANGLVEIAKQHPEAREAVVAALTRLLENYAEPGRDAALNAFFIRDLVGLHALEAAPIMERAFAAGVVDLDVAGDWEDTQIELGLKAERSAQPTLPEPKSQAPTPQPGSALESMRLMQQLNEQQSRLARRRPVATRAQPVEPPAPPTGPKRKHHRRK